MLQIFNYPAVFLLLLKKSIHFPSIDISDQMNISTKMKSDEVHLLLCLFFFFPNVSHIHHHPTHISLKNWTDVWKIFQTIFFLLHQHFHNTFLAVIFCLRSIPYEKTLPSWSCSTLSSDIIPNLEMAHYCLGLAIYHNSRSFSLPITLH